MSHYSTNITNTRNITNDSNTDAFPSSHDIPVVSSTSVRVFREYGLRVPMGLGNLKHKVEVLETFQKRLTDAKEHSTRDKIISILATMFALALIAGAVLGTYFSATIGTMGGGIATAAIPISTVLILNILDFVYTHKWVDKEDQQFGSDILRPLLAVIIGPFIPVWQTFGSISRCKRKIQKQQTQVQRELEEVRQFFTNNRLEVNQLNNDLIQSIEHQDAVLDNIRTAPGGSLNIDTQTAVSRTIDQLTRAWYELNEVRHFCTNDNDQLPNDQLPFCV